MFFNKNGILLKNYDRLSHNNTLVCNFICVYYFFVLPLQR